MWSDVCSSANGGPIWQYFARRGFNLHAERGSVTRSSLTGQDAGAIKRHWFEVWMLLRLTALRSDHDSAFERTPHEYMNIKSFCPSLLGRLLTLVLASGLYCHPQLVPAAQSEWGRVGLDGKLTYKTFAAGDHIMDFSHAGYRGGGVSLPTVPVKRTVTPSGGDDTAAIQKALNEVSRLELNGGFRGAVLLAPGVFNCSQPLTIETGGMVVRGSGSAPDGTTINMTGGPHLCLSIGGGDEPKPTGKTVAITDAYVPSGACSFHVQEAGGLQPGDTILVNRPATPAWVKFMGMDTLVRNGKAEHWVSGELHTERTVRTVSGNLLTLEVPLADSFDSRYLNPPGGSVVKCDLRGRPTQIGVEHLRIVSPPLTATITQPLNRALHLDGVSDAWVRDLKVENTINSFYFGGNTSRITIENVDIRHAVASLGAAKPADFWAGGTQTLVNRCSASGDNVFYFSTGARMMGPVVVLNCVFHGNGHLQPHMRWATGLLVDNCQVPEGGIDLMNRGIMGSGHGWAVGWAVAWNCVAKSYTIQQPPGSMNWAIGCRGTPETGAQPGDPKGEKLPSGILDSQGTPVAPSSLYLAQLKERLGAQALTNIGY